jgi:hypothetical protein
LTLAVVWGFVPLGSSIATAGGDGPARADAMAYIRVFGNLRVEFTGNWRPAIVRKGIPIATGSGFAIAPSGLVLTSHHVVEHEPVEVVIEGEPALVTVETRRVEADLAVLQVTASDLAYIPFGDSDAMEPGRPVTMLGFPFGRNVELAKPARADVIPDVTVTPGSFSAAREDEEGVRRYLQTDASLHPGNSGGPMIDEDGYAVGVVQLKLSREAADSGPGFGVPINLVKEFLEAHGLLAQLPAARLRPGVVHSLEWKGLRVELPEGFQDGSTARLRVEAGEPVDAIALRIERVATAWSREALELAALAGQALPGFAPAPAVPGRRIEHGTPTRVVASAKGRTPDGRPFRVEYTLLPLHGEALVARYLGPPDAVAFNAGLLRRSLAGLEADPLLTAAVRAPLAAAFDLVAFPGTALGRVPLPTGWSVEPASAASCGRMPRAEAGMAATPPGDFTIVLRVLSLGRQRAAAEQAARACGQGTGASAAGYVHRFPRLGVVIGAQAVLVPWGEDLFLLEVEAPETALRFVRDVFEKWVHTFAP